MNGKAYFGVKFYEDHRNRDEINSIDHVLKNAGFQTICIARDIEKWGEVTLSAQELMKITFAQINKSDFVVLEMSEKGVGLGIEAGYAVAQNKSLLVFIKKGLELSMTMRGIADLVIPYDHPGDIKEPVLQFLKQRVFVPGAGET